MNNEDVRKLPTFSGIVEGPPYDQKFPYEQLVKECIDGRFLDYKDPMYYHINTFWVTWRDEDYGSNQAVFLSVRELCDWIEECGGFAADDLFIVEEISSIRR
jgi:hypothetical protein